MLCGKSSICHHSWIMLPFSQAMSIFPFSGLWRNLCEFQGCYTCNGKRNLWNWWLVRAYESWILDVKNMWGKEIVLKEKKIWMECPQWLSKHLQTCNLVNVAHGQFEPSVSPVGYSQKETSSLGSFCPHWRALVRKKIHKGNAVSRFFLPNSLQGSQDLIILCISANKLGH